MPLASPRYPFARQFLQGAPSEPGVYALYQGRELLFLGLAERAGGIRARLVAHFSGVYQPQEATHYGWEIRLDPRIRYTELLEELVRAKKIPRFNEGDHSR